MEDNYPASSGVYELILEDTTPKEVYKTLKTISLDLKASYEKGILDSFSGALATRDLDDLYSDLLEVLTIRVNSDGNTVVTFNWVATELDDESLTQYYALKLQELRNPNGFVTSRTYTERPDGSTYYEHGMLLAEDFVLSTEQF